MRLSAITARAPETGMRSFRDVFGKAFIDPRRHAFRIKPVHDEVGDLVSEGVVGELEFRIAHDEETAAGMNPAGPFFKTAELLELRPIFRRFEDVDVRF